MLTCHHLAATETAMETQLSMVPAETNDHNYMILTTVLKESRAKFVKAISMELTTATCHKACAGCFGGGPGDCSTLGF